MYWTPASQSLMISSHLGIWNVRSNVGDRMLKKATFTPAHPRRAKTRPFLKFVLGARPSSTYRWERAGLGQFGAGRVEWRYASDALFTCGLASGKSGFGPLGAGGCNWR